MIIASQLVVCLIHFGKTTSILNDQILGHPQPWGEGNHKDGYLLGLDNLIGTLASVEERYSWALVPLGPVVRQMRT
jgi:hypothetical protein